MKLVIEEAESLAVERHLGGDSLVATSRIAAVEVLRAVMLANPDPAVRQEAELMLASCMLVEVTETVLSNAASLASASVRTLDAIHLASALHVEPDEIVVYDGRLAAAAQEHGLTVAAPR